MTPEEIRQWAWLEARAIVVSHNNASKPEDHFSFGQTKTFAEDLVRFIETGGFPRDDPDPEEKAPDDDA